MTQEEIAEKCLADLFKVNSYIRTSDLYRVLIALYPEHKWTRLWVSKFLYQKELNYTEDLSTRYWFTRELQMKEDFKNAFAGTIEHLSKNAINITKVNIKWYLKELGWVYGVDYTQEDFQKAFDNSNLVFTGNLGISNHKIYIVKKSNQHYSMSDQEVVDIEEMHPNYIYNIIQKHYSKQLVKDCFTRDTEIYQLLKAFFTFDIKVKIKNILN